MDDTATRRPDRPPDLDDLLHWFSYRWLISGTVTKIVLRAPLVLVAPFL